VDIKDAYTKVKKLPKRNVLLECLDTEDQWLFLFADRELERNECLLGAWYDAVNKTTGNLVRISATPANMLLISEGVETDTQQFN